MLAKIQSQFKAYIPAITKVVFAETFKVILHGISLDFNLLYTITPYIKSNIYIKPHNLVIGIYMYIVYIYRYTRIIV